ncbi:hypothetical protein [Saccharothrix sp. ST-888]|nr:hypothetical protein [Saccharothrix sp. ST-888]
MTGQEQLFVLITPELPSGRLPLPTGRAVGISAPAGPWSPPGT